MGGSTRKGGRGRGRGRPRGRPRGAGRGPGRPRKTVPVKSEDEEEEEQIETSELVDNMVELREMLPDVPTSVEDDTATLSKVPDESALLGDLESSFALRDDSFYRGLPYIPQFYPPPTFGIMNKTPLKSLQGLSWRHPYTPIGDRIRNPNIHMCDNCHLPIRIYGRLIPCKHVYCHSCSLGHPCCPRCSEKVHRIEKNRIGSLFMCLHEGSQYGYDGCRRTYLSQRDLQAHINHRHKPRPPPVVRNVEHANVNIPQSYGSFHGNTTRAKADSQSHHIPNRVYGSSPDISSPSSSTGPSRYDRDRDRNRGNHPHPHPHHSYQRPSSSNWQYRQPDRYNHNQQ